MCLLYVTDLLEQSLAKPKSIQAEKPRPASSIYDIHYLRLVTPSKYLTTSKAALSTMTSSTQKAVKEYTYQEHRHSYDGQRSMMWRKSIEEQQSWPRNSTEENREHKGIYDEQKSLMQMKSIEEHQLWARNSTEESTEHRGPYDDQMSFVQRESKDDQQLWSKGSTKENGVQEHQSRFDEEKSLVRRKSAEEQQPWSANHSQEEGKGGQVKDQNVSRRKVDARGVFNLVQNWTAPEGDMQPRRKSSPTDQDEVTHPCRKSSPTDQDEDAVKDASVSQQELLLWQQAEKPMQPNLVVPPDGDGARKSYASTVSGVENQPPPEGLVIKLDDSDSDSFIDEDDDILMEHEAGDSGNAQKESTFCMNRVCTICGGTDHMTYNCPHKSKYFIL